MCVYHYKCPGLHYLKYHPILLSKKLLRSYDAPDIMSWDTNAKQCESVCMCPQYLYSHIHGKKRRMRIIINTHTHTILPAYPWSIYFQVPLTLNSTKVYITLFFPVHTYIPKIKFNLLIMHIKRLTSNRKTITTYCSENYLKLLNCLFLEFSIQYFFRLGLMQANETMENTNINKGRLTIVFLLTTQYSNLMKSITICPSVCCFFLFYRKIK
jgi:hypothetical protein